MMKPAPPVYRPQGAPVQRKLAAPPVYRPQTSPVQRKMAAPAVYRPQQTPPRGLRIAGTRATVQPMSSLGWAALGAVGGFVGAAATAITAPVTVPTALAVGGATLATAAVAPLVGRGIEYFWRSPAATPAATPAAPASRPERVGPSSASAPPPLTRSASRDEKREVKAAEPEPDFFAGPLLPSIRVDLRQGELTASGAHHTDFEFRFAGTRQTKRYNLDPWIVGNRAIAQPAGQAATVLGLVGAWTCNDSIVDYLVNRLLLTANSGEPLEGTVDSAHLGTDGRRAFVLHLMALRANVAHRVSDVAANCPASVMIVPPKRRGVQPESETVQINWTPILRNGRERVRAAILAGTRCPLKDNVNCAHDALAAAVQPGLGRLRTLGFLVGSQFNASAGGSKLATGNKLNFAVGHLRFILYLEWRAVDELILGN